MIAAGLPPPRIRQTTFFNISFKRPARQDAADAVSSKESAKRRSVGGVEKGVIKGVESFAQSSEKSSEKGSEKICKTIKDNPKISARELSAMLGISSRAVEKRLAQLKKAGAIKRIGSAKGGHWEVVDG